MFLPIKKNGSNLKKAIKYHEEMADQDCYEDEQLKSAKIHETYARWLRELKWRRKQDKERNKE